jgi:tungstate transport system substrate-binding protein
MKSVEKGNIYNHGKVFDDYFIIIGPKSNEAGLIYNESVYSAFEKIAKFGNSTSESVFLSRDDLSSTNVKERTIWSKVEINPYESSWYYKLNVFPGEGLLKADEMGMYSISDLSTWIVYKNSIKNSQIFIKGGDVLLNPCFSVSLPNPSQLVSEFANYLISRSCQELISKYGNDEYGHCIFKSAADL